MVGIAKWLRHQIVALICVGSTPITHPILRGGKSQLVFATALFDFTLLYIGMSPSR